jgi:hypothetical protein
MAAGIFASSTAIMAVSLIVNERVPSWVFLTMQVVFTLGIPVLLWDQRCPNCGQPLRRTWNKKAIPSGR